MKTVNKDDPLEIVRGYGIVVASFIGKLVSSSGRIPRCVSFAKDEGQWTFRVGDQPPIFSGVDGERLNEQIFHYDGCGAPLAIVQDFPRVTLGCLRCHFGVDVMDIFPRGACP